MDRVNGNNPVDIGEGRRGFKSQNAAAGIAGTEVTDKYLNDVQEEICAVIESAGLTLDPQNQQQLWEALQSIAAPGFANRAAWLPVLSLTIKAPPTGSALGDAYVIPAGATGVWSDHQQKLAEWNGLSWRIVSTKDGHGVSLPDGRVFEKVAGLYVEKPALDAQSGKWSFATASGSANTITATLTPAPAELVEGMAVCLRLSATNTGPATLNLNGLGAKAVTDRTSTALSAGDLQAGEYALLRYDGVRWRVELTYGQLDRRYTRLPTPPANTFYVVGPTGNDSNSGLANTPADGFATIQGAIDAITRRYLTSGDITIRVANGTYDGFSLRSSFVSNWIIVGNEDNFSLVKVNALTSGVNRGRGCSVNAVNALIAGMEFKSLYENVSNNLGNVTVRNCNINLPSNADITAIGSYGGRLILEGRINIAGSGAYFLFSSQGAAIQVGYADAGGSTLVTLNYNNPTFSISNILAADCGTIFVSPSSVTINGSANGPRYNASTNGIIKTYGAGENFFPGSVAGGVWNGGQYV